MLFYARNGESVGWYSGLRVDSLYKFTPIWRAQTSAFSCTRVRNPPPGNSVCVIPLMTFQLTYPSFRVFIQNICVFNWLSIIRLLTSCFAPGHWVWHDSDTECMDLLFVNGDFNFIGSCRCSELNTLWEIVVGVWYLSMISPHLYGYLTFRNGF